MLRKAVVLLVLGLAGAGCGLMPPSRIPVDRVDYLDAINTSWKKQLLNNLVMLRNGDSLTFLELTQVVTNYHWTASATAGYNRGLQIGTTIAKESSETTTTTAGPTGGATFEYGRSPAITYSPIRGESLRKIMMDPIPLDTVLKSLQIDTFAPYILPLTVESMTVESKKTYSNNSKGDPRFSEIVGLFNELWQKGAIQISTEEMKESSVEVKATTEEKEKTVTKGDPNKESTKTTTTSPKEPTTKTVKKDIPNYYLVFNEARAKSNQLENFKRLLSGEKKVKKYLISRSYQPERPKDMPDDVGVIFIQPRSIMQILVLLSPRGKLAVKDLERFEIKEIEDFFQPKETFVATKDNGVWYYIPNSDDFSKKVFSLTVLLLAMSESGK